MRRIWPYIYWVGAIACVLAGFHGSTSESAAHWETGWGLVAGYFLAFALYPIFVVAFCKDTLCRPSQFVKPTNSPLQIFRMMLVAFTFIGLGDFAALPWATHEGFMSFWVNVASVAGLFLGEQIIYKVIQRKLSPESRLAWLPLTHR